MRGSPRRSLAFEPLIPSGFPYSTDGNKRTGFVATALLIEANGFSFQATEEEAVLEALALASGESTEADYAAWLGKNSVLA